MENNKDETVKNIALPTYKTKHAKLMVSGRQFSVSSITELDMLEWSYHHITYNSPFK